jgi:hypothetical protein
MDITVKAEADGASWAMVDLLGRSMGKIVQTGSTFAVEPAGRAMETMQSMKRSPFASLDEVLAAIETHTRSTCQLEATAAGSIAIDELRASSDE